MVDQEARRYTRGLISSPAALEEALAEASSWFCVQNEAAVLHEEVELNPLPLPLPPRPLPPFTRFRACPG